MLRSKGVGPKAIETAQEDFESWSGDRARARQAFYHADGETTMTYITCIPEHALDMIGCKTPDDIRRVRVEFLFYGKATDSQGKPVVACVLSVKKP